MKLICEIQGDIHIDLIPFQGHSGKVGGAILAFIKGIWQAKRVIGHVQS